MQIYLVKTPSGERLIEAVSKSAAIKHVNSKIEAMPVTASELLKRINAGEKVEAVTPAEKEKGAKPNADDALDKAEAALRNAG